MRTKGLRAVLLACLVVFSMLTAGTGTAVAASDTCSELDEFVWVFTIGIFNSDKCDSSSLSQEIQEIRDAEDNQTHLDLYHAAASQDANTENIKDIVQSYGQDTETFGFIKGENASVVAMQNGKTRSQMNNSVTTEVGDYYSAAQEMRYIRALESAHRAIVYNAERAKTEGIPVSDVLDEHNSAGTYPVNNNGDQTNDGDWEIIDARSATIQHTLVNGTTINVTVAEVRSDYVSGLDGDDWVQLSLWGGYTHPDTYGHFGTNDPSPHFEGVVVEPPAGSSYDDVVMFDDQKTQPIRTDISDRTTRVIDNAKQYGNAMYDDYESGTFDPSNYTSPYVMAQEWATDYNGTGYWSYAVAVGAAAGYETPDLNNTGRMSVDVGGNVYHGLLFSSEAPPGGQWNSSETYDGSTINGSQILITDDGKKLDLSESTFTLEEIQDKDGTVINETTVNRYTYETINSSDYLLLQEQVLDLIKQIEDREPAGTGGGATSDGFWPPFGLTEAQAAVGGAAIVGLGLLGMSGKGRRY